MRVMSAYQIGAIVDCHSRYPGLILVGHRVELFTPMDDANHQLSAFRLNLGNVLLDLGLDLGKLSVDLVHTQHTDLHALHIHDRRLVEAKMYNIFGIQRFQCICISLVQKVIHVVICGVHGLDISIGQDLRVFHRRLEVVVSSLTLGLRRGQRRFQIRDGQVIRGENILHVLHEVGAAIHIIIIIEAGIIVERRIHTERTVTYHAQCD